jgi:hypothetical protein
VEVLEHASSRTNCTVAPVGFNIIPWYGQRRKDSPSIVVEMFTAPLHSNGHGADHVENTVLLLSRACMLRELPNNGRCL